MLEKEMKLLFDAIVQRSSIQNTCTMLEKEIFSNPVMITNAYFHVLSLSSQVKFEDSVWNYAQEYNCCSKESIESFRNDAASKELFSKGKAFVYDYGLGEIIPRILASIVHNETILGYLIVFELNHKFSQEDIDKANLVCQTLSILLENDHSSHSKMEYFIREILEVSESNRMKLENEIYQTVKESFPYYKVIVARKSKDGTEAYYNYVCELINSLNQNVFSLLYKHDIVTIVNFEKEEQLKETLDKVERICFQNNLLIGLSMTFKTLIRLKVYVEQAIHAREIGMLIDPKKRSFPYSRYISYDMMNRYNRDELKAFICKEYEILKQYDENNGSELLHTCITYYLNSSNITETSAVLHIHRNTLFYRLKQIEKTIHIQMSDVEMLSLIYLSKKIDRWIHINYS